jgi:hypothetical protein
MTRNIDDMSVWRDIDAPDTSWRPGSEDPIPLLLGRNTLTSAVYRWFALRPLDGHARSNNTFHQSATVFYTRTGNPPWPTWFHTLPRKKQALFTRLPFTTWLLSFPAAFLAHVLTAYLGFYVHALIAIVSAIVAVLSW